MAASEVIASDLLEVFGGIFPEEDLAKDEPLLASIAQELFSEHEGDLNAVLQEILVADYGPVPVPTKDEFREEGKIVEITDEEQEQAAEKAEVAVQKPKEVVDDYICKACKGPSEGIRSFGALVCMSCRAFFVRSIKNNGHEKFVCKQAKSRQEKQQEPRELCPINSRSWKSCKRCRFDQCLKVGMKIPDKQKKKKEAETRIALPDNRNSIQKIKSHYIKFFTGKMRLYNDVSSRALSIAEFERLEEFVHFHIDLSTKVYCGLARQFNGVLEICMEMIFQARWYPLYMDQMVNSYQHYCAKELFMQQTGYPWDVVKGADKARLSLANGPLVMEYLTASRLFKTSCNEVEFDHIIDIMFNDPDEAFGSMVKTSYLKVSLSHYDI